VKASDGIFSFFSLSVLRSLIFNALFFFNYVIIFDKDGALLLATAFGSVGNLRAAEREHFKEFKFNQHKNKQPEDEVEKKDNCVTFEVVPGPELVWKLFWNRVRILTTSIWIHAGCSYHISIR